MNYLANQILEGKAVLFLGAGASYNCQNRNGQRIGLTGNQLKEKISEAFLGGKEAASEMNLDVASAMAIRIAGRARFDQFLKNLVHDFEPTSEHNLITQFRWKSIFTTNYDEAIETAYRNNRDSPQKIERILCDNDSIQHILVQPDKLPLIKIHGCISRINDRNVPLVIASTDYRRHQENRSSLYQTLFEALSNDIVIFYGYGLLDANIIGIIDKLEEEGVERSRHVWIDPYMNELKRDFWESKNLDCREETLQAFLSGILQQKPNNLALGIALQNDSCISKIIPSIDRPSIELEAYLKDQLVYLEMNKEIFNQLDSYKNEIFYRGNSHGFVWLEKGLDFERTLEKAINAELFQNFEASNNLFHFCVINGYAGSGKTVLLKRIAWNGIKNSNGICFYLKEGGVLNSNFVSQLVGLIKEPIILFIDDILEHQSEISKIKDFAIKGKHKIYIVGASRTNEWNNENNLLEKFSPLFFSLLDLNDYEIKSLLAKLAEFNVEGGLKDLNYDDKVRFIRENSEKQLLVTLLEASHHGQDFAEIIKDEYEGIYNRSAKELYLNICSLHRHGIELRAGMIKRLSGIDFHQFKDKFLKPLELLVVTYFSHRCRDNVYTSRHLDIAAHVYSQAFHNELEKAQHLIQILRFLNTGYDIDAKAIELILKGKTLAMEFKDKELAAQIFNVANEIGLNNCLVWHQKAIYEINHDQPNYDLALQYLKHIDPENGHHYDMRIVEHTKANIYRKLALKASTLDERERYRGISLRLLSENIRKNPKSSMPFVTKAYVLLDEIKDCTEDGLIIDIIKDFETNLAIGFKKFPYDDALSTVEHDFSKEINNSPRAIAKIEEALRRNSDNVFVVSRYAKFYIDRGEFNEARTCMNNFLRNNINNKEINYLMALSFIKEDKSAFYLKAISYLKKCYSPNDSNYEPKFKHACLEYEFGDEKKALKIFNELVSSSIRANIKNRTSNTIVLPNKSDKYFEGKVITINDDYGFVKTSNFNENIYVHRTSSEDKDLWEVLRSNDEVLFSIWFTFKGPRVKQLKIK